MKINQNIEKYYYIINQAIYSNPVFYKEIMESIKEKEWDGKYVSCRGVF